jgi:hypothetical protein
VDEINYFKTWITDRLDWLDVNIPKLEAVITALDRPENGTIIYPNPFQQSIRLKVRVQAGEDISMSVLDLLGREVASISAIGAKSGNTELWWNGKNKSGTDLSSGIYLIRIYQGEKLIGKEKIIKN